MNRLFASSVLGLALALPLAAVAQTQTSQPAFTPPMSDEPLVSLDFKGGTVSEYVEALRSASKDRPVNVVFSAAAAEVRLAPVRLSSVLLSDAVKAIETAAGIESGGWRIGRITSREVSLPAGGAPSYSIEYMPRSVKSSRDAMEQPSVLVISLRDLIEPSAAGKAVIAESPETLLTAVEGAAQMATQSGVEAATIRFHKESGLLIVRGIERQREAVTSVVNEIRTDLMRRRSVADRNSVTSRELTALRAAVARAEVQMRMATERRRALDDSRERTRKLVESGAVPEGDLRKAEMEAFEAQQQIEMSQVDFERAQAELRDAEQGSAASTTPAPADRVSLVLTIPKSDVAVYTSICEAAGEVGRSLGVQLEFSSQDRRILVTGTPDACQAMKVVLKELTVARGLPEPESHKATR